MNNLLSPSCYIGEYEDGFSIEMMGNDIGDCLYKLTQLEDTHGQLVWYGGLCDENYQDGELIMDAQASIQSATNIKKPSFYDTRFGDKVRKAYDSGQLNTSTDSIVKWFKAYNDGFGGPSYKEIRNIQDIISYYVANGGAPASSDPKKFIENCVMSGLDVFDVYSEFMNICTDDQFEKVCRNLKLYEKYPLKR